jgi:paxillin
MEPVLQLSPPDLSTGTQAPPPRCSSAQSFNRRPSAISVADSNAGRPLARPPSQIILEDVNMEGNDEDDLPYLERGQRWMERQEAHSLRKALEDMDLAKEQKLHEAAQKEASELVWKHQNPSAAFRNPDAPFAYREHLRKESIHARTASWSKQAQDIQTRNKKMRSRDSSQSRSISGGSKSTSAPSSRVASDSSLRVPDSPTSPIEDASSGDGERQSRKRSVQFVEPPVESNAGTTKNDKRARTPSPVKVSKSTVIVEKKKADDVPEVKVSNVAVAVRVVSNSLPTHFRNPFARVRNAKGSLSRSSTAPMPERKGLNSIEIQKNPPTQSRNPAYTANTPVNPEKAKEVIQEEIKMKDGLEIRGDDIRKATSMSLKDRSAKLPTPTMVSASPGRPIVSFKQNWKPKEVELKQETSSAAPAQAVPKPYSKFGANKPLPSKDVNQQHQSSIVIPDRGRERTSPPPLPASSIPSIQIGGGPGIPSISVNSGPAVPSISVNNVPSTSVNNAPSISVNAPSIAVSPPTISVNAPPAISVNGPTSSRRPLPTPAGRPSPHHANTAPATSLRSKGHFTPTSVRASGALCANCSLPIAGRIVSAGGVRFHPECFRCHNCFEGLECVAFYPEPDNSRAERIERIRARAAGHYVEERVGQTQLEDGDENLRFYCHLDFHEFFSPRCKSCKTPIEGEVVVACGAEWHAGHFFCAQCGDVCSPFVFCREFVLILVLALRLFHTLC